jgi:hypothetical protein
MSAPAPGSPAIVPWKGGTVPQGGPGHCMKSVPNFGDDEQVPFFGLHFCGSIHAFSIVNVESVRPWIEAILLFAGYFNRCMCLERKDSY